VEWLKDDSDFKVCVKSRRIGISWAEASDATLYAASADGGDTYYIGFDKEMARGFIEDCAEWARLYQLAITDEDQFFIKEPDKDILVYEIRFASGSKIQALSSSPRQLRSRGKRKPHIVIDECAHIADFPGILKAAIALTMWGAKIRCISTYNGEEEFSDLVDDIRAQRRFGTVYEFDLHRALADGLYEKIATKMNYPKTNTAKEQWLYKLMKIYGADSGEELFCHRTGGVNIFFPRSMIVRCMRPGVKIVRYHASEKIANSRPLVRQQALIDYFHDRVFDTLPSGPLWFGMDIGRVSNLTSVVFLKRNGLFLETSLVVELFNVHLSDQQMILFSLLNKIDLAGGCIDARGMGHQMAETAQDHFDNIAAVQISDKWYAQWMPRYRQYIEDQQIILPEDNEILSDHRAIKKVNGVAKIVGIQKNKRTEAALKKMKRHGDTAIAFCLAVQGTEEFEETEIEILTGGQREYA
jgi:phage FluMu gp28-like protein